MVKIYKPRIILTDCDGVILWWLDAFAAFMAEKGHTQEDNTDHEYSMSKRYLVEHPEMMKLVSEFNNSEKIRDLQPLLDSVEIISKLNVKHGFRFIAITSLSDDPVSKGYRIENLEKYFGNVFNEVHCLSIGADKSPCLENWENSGLFWIEDNTAQAMAGHKLGLQTLLIDHPTNAWQLDLPFTRICGSRPWSEIYQLICEDYGLEE